VANKKATKAAKPVPKPDRIQLWRITTKREHYDLIPFDWPQRFIESDPALILRPMPNAVLPKPISVEVLGPTSVLRRLKKEIGDQFTCIIVSADK
jgi:hypothetical protein